jgi:MFS-type transporter involved in bile tolerance (Atg22 family)
MFPLPCKYFIFCLFVYKKKKVGTAKLTIVILFYSSEAGLQALATVAITYLTDQLQFTARENGVAILLMLIGSIPGAPLSNFLSRRYDPIRSSMAGILLLIVVTACFALFAVGPGQYLRTYIMSFFWGVGVGMAWTVERLLSSSIIPEGQDTELMGVFLFAGQCLSWLPPLVYTALNEAGVSQRIGVASLAMYLVISLFGYCCMGTYTQAREEVGRETVYKKKDPILSLAIQNTEKIDSAEAQSADKSEQP